MSDAKTIDCGEFKVIMLNDGTYPGFKIDTSESSFEVTEESMKAFPRLAAATKAIGILLGCMAIEGIDLEREPDDSPVVYAIGEAIRLIADDPYLNGIEGRAFEEYATE